MEEISWNKSSKSRVAGFANVKLIHRQDHPANGIVKALNTEPVMNRDIDFGRDETPGRVSIHPYGDRQIVVRWLRQGRWAQDMFRKLESARKRNAGFDEQHIGYVKPRGSQSAALVTLVLVDEKNERLPTFAEYFNDRRNPKDHLLEVGLRAMEKIAELHANGFSHGHPNRHNLLVENAGAVRLIDPKDITRLYRIGKKTAEQLRLKDRNALAEHVLEMLDDRNEFKDSELDAFSDQLDEQYLRHYQACLKRLKERKL